MAQYGLIGEKLGHSFSKPIHEALADYTYELMPMPKDEVFRFFEQRDFAAVNVTIPYKETVIPLCDEIDAHAEAIGAVNTVVNRGGKLYGYNTDFAGFLYTVKKLGVDPKDKKVLILGSGGTCKTVSAVMRYCGAAEVTVVSRSGKNGAITYEEAKTKNDTAILINASPCGMFPDNDGLPIDLDCFPKLCAVFDVIYNPLRTNLLLEAQKRGIPNIGGLLMLVAQAKFAVEHFLGNSLDDSRIEEICGELMLKKRNLVLMGMPSCGKSTLGRIIAKETGRTFVDLDNEIVKEAGMDIPTIFAQKGELWFRELEERVAARFSKENGIIIGCGGGTVLREASVRRLKQNGLLWFIDTPLSLLAGGNGRPLAKSKEQITALFEQRTPIYRAAADDTTVIPPDPPTVEGDFEHAMWIKERFYETARG